MLTNDELLELAGKQAFARGQAYCADGRIALTRNDDDALEGEAEGSEKYPLWLKREDRNWLWDCACPAADGGGFCKHLVAAVLTAREERDDDTTPRVNERGNALADYLLAQPAERLARWLLEFAVEDASIEKQLRLYRAAENPAELKSALGRMLDAGGFLDYRRSIAYARRLGGVAAQLRDAIARNADDARTLCEYVLGRLLKIYERSDDSSGAIGDQLRIIAGLHAQAFAAAQPAKTAAKALLALQQKDDWDLFPLHAYWKALGAPGQVDYAKRVLAEFESLPQGEPGIARRSSPSFHVMRRTEALARARGDFELLQRVLRRNLSLPRDYLRVLESLREFDRTREALAWVEQAVKRFPEDDELRVALADCLAAAGLREEATEQAWHAYQLRPDADNWDALKRIAGRDWQAWRVRAIDEVASREHGDASERVTLLEHDGDLAGALAVARTCKLRPEVLERLARRVENDMPALAGEFYLRLVGVRMQNVDYNRHADLVRTLQHAARCLPGETAPIVASVRKQHAKKLKLIRLLDEAGLR